MLVNWASYLDPNWVLLWLFELGEKRALTISDHRNTEKWLILLLVIFAIMIVLGLHLNQLAVNKESNSNASAAELDQYFFGGDDIHFRLTNDDCSVECQIRHWRSGHNHECPETDTSSADQARDIDVHEAYLFVNKSGKESTCNGSNGEGITQSSIVNVDCSIGSDITSFHACQVCGRPSTTRCSRCKIIKYCSVKCLILDWKWHKPHCVASDVISFSAERPRRDDLTKETKENRTKSVRYLEDEVTTSRNESLLLELERDKWMMRANFARERFRSLRKESERQLFVLKNEKESISIADRQAQNVIRNLNERLHHLQIALQESITEKKKLREQMQMVESELNEARKDLKEEQKRYRYLKIEYDKSHETAENAIKDVQRVKQELQVQCEQIQLLKEKFLREVTSAASRASFAEAKLSDLHKKIKSTDNKICAICLTNEKDLAFGCGHMTCVDCGSKLSKCPICREHITSHIKLFPG